MKNVGKDCTGLICGKQTLRSQERNMHLSGDGLTEEETRARGRRHQKVDLPDGKTESPAERME